MTQRQTEVDGLLFREDKQGCELSLFGLCLLGWLVGWLVGVFNVSAEQSNQRFPSPRV